MVLCQKDPSTALIKESPLKKSKNGMLPPTKPIDINKNQCLFVNFFNFFQSLNKINKPESKTATTRFFKNVKILELITATPNLLMKIEIPEITAVRKSKK